MPFAGNGGHYSTISKGGVTRKRATIDVEHDGKEYIASWGQTLSGRNSTLAGALRLLADEIAALKLGFGTPPEVEGGHETDAPCKNCGASVFFAKISTGRFLAFDIEPFEAEQVVGTKVAYVQRMGKQTLAQWPVGPSGTVWIPHTIVCGATTSSPMNPLVKARWEKNHTAVTELAANAVNGLRSILNDLDHM